jgi:PAS domain S-box-containing protein
MTQAVRDAIRGTEPLIRSSRVGIHVFDRAGRFVLWNAALEQMTGMRERDVLGLAAFDLFPFFGEAGDWPYFQRALAGETCECRERPFSVVSTGKTGFFNATYSPVLGSDGGVVGGIGLIQDITEERRRTAALSETETRFQNMADVSPVLLWMAGTDSLCNFFNQTWLDFTGRKLEQELGVGWAEGVHVEDFQRCIDTYMAAFNARRRFEMEYRLRRADGEYRWLLDRGAPRFAADGSFAGYIGSCVDITDFKVLENELRRSVESRDDFISVASHELKTPLTSLQLQLELVQRILSKRAESPPGDVLPKVGAALSQIYRLGKLVEQLLDVSRVNTGRLRLDYEAARLDELVKESTQRMMSSAEAAGSALSVEGNGAIEGRWDRIRMDQVLRNLIGNAIKYGRGLPVVVSYEANGAHVRISVRDQGIGISPQDHDRIFERFERAVTARHYSGLGLGLWITREIVTAHGGSISVVSQPGAGSTFTVDVPLVPKAEAVRDGRPARAAAG